MTDRDIVSSESESTSDENQQMLTSNDIHRFMNWSNPHIERNWYWHSNEE